MRVIEIPLAVNEECGTCGGDVGPSSTFPWHYEDEDCRAVREPILEPTIIVKEDE